MLDINEIKPGIIFVPDYMIGTLEHAGVTLSDIAWTVSHTDDEWNENNSDEIKEKVIDVLNNKISRNDTLDMRLLNINLNKHIYNNNCSYDDERYNVTVVGKYNDLLYNDSLQEFKDIGNEIINSYANNNIEYESILLNGDNNNNLFNVEIYDKVVFVIIHEGFTNFIVNNDQKVRDKLSIRLLDYMFTGLGSESAYKSAQFQMIKRLIK